MKTNISLIYIQSILIFISLRLIYSSNDTKCTEQTTEELCSKYTDCKWNVNTSDTSCSNKDLGCSNKDKQSCLLTTDFCAYQEPLDGGCQRDRTVDCSKFSQTQCKYQGQRCSWQSAFKCENYSDGFNCISKNEQQCVNSNDYCNSSFQCTGTKDMTLCSFKEKNDCITSNSYCQYNITSPQSCSDRSSYCQNLSGEDCLTDTAFCSFQQSSPSQCINKTADTICGNKTQDDCIKASQFCDSITTTYSCTNKVTTSQCALNVNQDTCTKAVSCQWLNDSCVAVIECSKLSQTDCELQQNTTYCISNPVKVICKNKSDFGCSQYNNLKSQCQQYQDYCSYQSLTGTCFSINNCKVLTPSQCVSVANKCLYSAEVGNCTLKDKLDCDGMDQETCLSKLYCVFQFLGCSDKNQDLCSTFNLSQCNSNTAFCQIANIGVCSDNSQLNCQQYTDTDCSTHEGCLSYTKTLESCYNKIDCKKLSDLDCQKSSTHCNYTPLNGYCNNVIEVTIQSHKISFIASIIILFYLFCI